MIGNDEESDAKVHAKTEETAHYAVVLTAYKVYRIYDLGCVEYRI